MKAARFVLRRGRGVILRPYPAIQGLQCADKIISTPSAGVHTSVKVRYRHVVCQKTAGIITMIKAARHPKDLDSCFPQALQQLICFCAFLPEPVEGQKRGMGIALNTVQES